MWADLFQIPYVRPALDENFCIKKINSFIYKPVKLSFLFLYLLLHSVGGWLVTIFIGLKFLFGRFKKKQAEKLQILEDAGLAEIKKAVEEGTYVEGPQHSKAYLTFRAIRSAISTIIVLAFIGVLFYVAFSRS